MKYYSICQYTKIVVMFFIEEPDILTEVTSTPQPAEKLKRTEKTGNAVSSSIQTLKDCELQ